ncbi:MAG: iron-containing alcohol dehydrogenase [Rhodobacteraceae bacterium]|nr:iron-containing alcohol dehydrogenase [Paracoccaceae bacterium]
MIETLRGMDDRLLRDIGIDRSDIPRVVDGLTERERRMRPVSSDVEHDYRRRRNQAA